MIKKESKFQSKELMQPSVHVQNLRERGIHKIILLNSHSNLTWPWSPFAYKVTLQKQTLNLIKTLLKNDQMSIHITLNIQVVGLQAVRKKMSLLHISPCKADHKSLKQINLQQTQSRCKF